MKHAVSLFLCLILLVAACFACSERMPDNRIDPSVLFAWEGDYTKDARAEAIAEYEKWYIPVYAANVETDTVSFEIAFEGVSCGKVMLAPVTDGGKNAEADTIVDFSAESAVDGSVVTVNIGWWNEAPASVQSYQLWSYLLWVRDADGRTHYYYFRVDYTA